MSVQVVVKNRAGDCVGTLSEAGFPQWKREQQKSLGGRIAIVIEGRGAFIDTGAAMRKLPPGTYEAVLVQRSAIPHQVRRKLKDCDLWRVV